MLCADKKRLEVDPLEDIGWGIGLPKKERKKGTRTKRKVDKLMPEPDLDACEPGHDSTNWNARFSCEQLVLVLGILILLSYGFYM